MHPETDAPPPRAGRREWIGLAVLALPCLLYSMDLTVLHLAVPEISAAFEPSSAQLLWIIDIYGFLVAGSLITMGTLGDRIGRRRLLMIGAAAFGIASVLAAFSTSAEMLIATRALLGLAGATLAPSTLSLLRNMFLDPAQRTTAIAVWITSYSIGGALGPVIGGVVLEFFWWGAVFLIGVPIMVLLLAVGPFLLPEFRDPNAGRPDLPSMVLSLAAVLAVIFGLKQIAQDGMALLPALTIAGGIALAVIFARRQQRLADPLIDLRLFRIPAFSASLATYGLGVLIVFGGFLFLPQFLQLIVGLSPLEAALWMLPWAIGFIGGSALTPFAVRYLRPATVMAGGMVIGALGFFMFTRLQPDSGFWYVLAGSALYSLGFAPMFTLTIDLIVGAAPPERAGAASAISETSAEFGGALGIAVFGSIGVAVYRGELDGAIPAGVPAQSAVVARDTLGGAVHVAATLPAELAAALTDLAADAFLLGLQLGAAISAVGALGLALFVLLALRRVGAPPHGRSEGEAPGDEPHAGRALEPAAPV